MDLLNGTGTHYDKNCWVYGEVLWLSARSPSEYAGKWLKMAVSKRLADHHRAAGKIPVLYAHARGSYDGWDSTQANSTKKEGLLCRVVMEWQDSVECRSSRSNAESPKDLTIFRTFYYLFANTLQIQVTFVVKHIQLKSCCNMSGHTQLFAVKSRPLGHMYSVQA